MVITSFSRKGYDEYGLEFIKTFLKHTDHKLTVYHEGIPDDAPEDPRVSYVDMTKEQHFLDYARKLYDADPLYQGVMLNGDQKIYNFRFDAFKFFRKVWSLKHYDETRLDDDLIVWLDADIKFNKDVPHDLFEKQLKGNYLAYIGRGGGMHSECGAMIFDPANSQHGNFFELYWRIYETGAFRRLEEYHDSYVFDFIRDLVQPSEVNLGKGCDPVHPFVFTKFGLYMDHKKGPERKKMGYSPEGRFSKPMEITNRDIEVSNNGERQARKSISQMKANHVERYKWAAKQLNGVKTVLDAACGVGYGSRMLAEGRDIVFGVDVSQEALDYAKDHYDAENVVYSRFDLADEAPELPLADAVVSLETIEHVPDSGALVKAFAKHSNVLIGSVPNQDVVPFDKKTHPYHYRHFTKTELEQLLNGAGWHVEKWATQYDKIPGLVTDDKTDGMCILFEARRVVTPEGTPVDISKVQE